MQIPEHLRPGLIALLKQDPRPGYQAEPERIYGLSFGGFDIRFSVKENCLTVVSVTALP